MERVAEEWARQGETVDPADMPLTRLLNSAIDGVARTMDETRAEIARYAGSDLLCYRAEEPEALAERQRLAFDPVLAWAAETLGARFNLAAGVVHVAQPPEALAAVSAALDAVDDPAALAALSVMTSLTGSALLALAVARGRSTAEEAWAPPMSTRISRSSAGASTRRRRRGARRAGARWRRRGGCWLDVRAASAVVAALGERGSAVSDRAYSSGAGSGAVWGVLCPAEQALAAVMAGHSGVPKGRPSLERAMPGHDGPPTPGSHR